MNVKVKKIKIIEKLDAEEKPNFAKNFDRLMAKYIKKAIKNNASGSAE